MESLFRLDDRIALVTGASSGLGRHFTDVLIDAGASVALAARRTERLHGIATKIEDRGGRAVVCEMDVTKPKTIDLSFNRIEEELGTIDILVNNAGIASTSLGLELSETDWDEVIDTNLKGAWLVAQQAAQRLIKVKKL